MSNHTAHRFSSLDGEIIESDSTLLPAPGMINPPERSVFTTLKVKNGRLIFFDDHIMRLQTSAKALGLGKAIEKTKIRERCQQLVAANESPNCALRIAHYDESGECHTALQTRDIEYSADQYARGFRLMTVRADPAQDTTREHKTFTYRDNLEALAKARRQGFDEALFVNSAGDAWECAISNLFAVSGGIVSTPPTSSGALPGVVRAHLFKSSNKILIERKPLSLDRLLTADEVFVTNSLLGLMPVSAIDNQAFPISDDSVAAELRAEIERWENLEG